MQIYSRERFGTHHAYQIEERDHFWHVALTCFLSALLKIVDVGLVELESRLAHPPPCSNLPGIFFLLKLPTFNCFFIRMTPFTSVAVDVAAAVDVAVVAKIY
jgi:hypothetical protein